MTATTAAPNPATFEAVDMTSADWTGRPINGTTVRAFFRNALDEGQWIEGEIRWDEDGDGIWVAAAREEELFIPFDELILLGVPETA